MCVQLTEEKCAEGRELRPHWLFMQPEKEVPSKDIQWTVSCLNFVERAALGCCRHPQRVSGWDIVNASGEMDKWIRGSRAADCRVRVSEEFTNDANW